MSDVMVIKKDKLRLLSVRQEGCEIRMNVIFDLTSLHILRSLLDEYENVLLTLEIKP